MILPINSYLRHPPVEISPNQILLFNAIRYSADICEISFSRLLQTLSQLTENNDIKNFDFPVAFLDIWSVINNSVIFKKILCREFKLTGNEKHFEEINKAVKLRDSNQHIDERLLDGFPGTDYPIYGSLSWIKYYNSYTNFIRTTLFSGSFTQKENINTTLSNKEDIEYDLIIQKIQFTGIIREGKKGNYSYREESILISKIITEMIWWISELDKNLEEMNKTATFTSSHRSDFFMQIKGRIIDQDELINYNHE